MALKDLIPKFIDISMHLDDYLGVVVTQYGMWTYPIIFIVLFLETGDIISAFLPSDSLIFAAGALAGAGLLNIFLLYTVCVAGVFLGDTCNYWIGRLVGYVILREKFKFINETHIEKTKTFFTKYGPYTLIIGRFIPFVRTLTPFFAGIGKMPYLQFSMLEAIGASTWVALFVFGGYFFGTLPFVQDNLIWIIVFIGAISFIPVMATVIKYFLKKRQDKLQQTQKK